MIEIHRYFKGSAGFDIYPEDNESMFCILIEFSYGKMFVSGNQREKKRIPNDS
jgi:hypothetical protein